MSDDYDLPRGWRLVTTGDVADVTLGKTPKRNDYRSEGQYRLFKYRDLQRGQVVLDQTKDGFVRSDPSLLRGLRTIEVGDVLIGASGHSSGSIGRKVAIVTELPAGGPHYLAGELLRIRPDPDLLDGRWAAHFFASEEGFRTLQDAVTGVHLTNGPARQMVIPLPPLKEQMAICGVLTGATVRSRSVDAHLANARRIVDRFRQAVLAAACSGRLTAAWREQNPDVEGAEKVASQSAYCIAEPEEGLAELPDKWAWVALGNYARCSRGRFSVRPRNDPSCFNGEHPFIQIGNLNPDGGWVRSHTQTLNAKGLSVSKKFPKGTAVIAIVGATIGNTGLLAYDMCFPDSLVGLETGAPEGNRYVEFFLRGRKHAIRNASYSSGGQPNIKLESLNPYPLALPPLAEQREIVRRVDGLLHLADGIQDRIDAASKRVDRSSQAVLAKAFRGELHVATNGELRDD